MKRLPWLLILLAAAAPTWGAATKMTVAELQQKLVAQRQSSPSDEEVAAQLKQVTLTEQITPAARAALNPLLPGPLSEEQIDILQARTSMLPPPATDLPTTPAPDAATQKAILAKAQDFVGKTYTQSPHVSVSRAVTRFQDDAGNTSSTPGLFVNMPNTFTRLVEAHTDQVEIDKGVEKPAASRTKTKWGQNGLVSEGEPGPVLAVALQDLTANGNPQWLRWEAIDGKSMAVFSFAIDKKKSHFLVNYCCFPSTETQDHIATPAGGVTTQGDIQSVSDFRPFKKVAGYHGQLFVDPTTGAVVRIITYADLKPSDYVHQEIMRVDYAPVVVNGTEYPLPVDSYAIDEVVPGGDSAAYTVRHTFFAVRYQNYQPAAGR